MIGHAVLFCFADLISNVGDFASTFFTIVNEESSSN